MSVLIGILLRFAVYFSDRAAGNAVFSKFLSSFLLTAAAFAFVRLGVRITYLHYFNNKFRFFGRFCRTKEMAG